MNMIRQKVEYFVKGLKDRHEDVRDRASKELQAYVRSEFQDLSVEDSTLFLTEFSNHVYNMIASSENHEKKGAVLAIVHLCEVDQSRHSRYTSYLRNLLPTYNDPSVMELVAYSMRCLSLNITSPHINTYLEFEIQRALEWLQSEKPHDGQVHAAILVLQELVDTMSAFFAQHLQAFFDNIFVAIRDPKPALRECGVRALRAVFTITAQRESKDAKKLPYYQYCYAEAMKTFEGSDVSKGVVKDERIHSSLLVLNELFRVSNAKWESKCNEVEEFSSVIRAPVHQRERDTHWRRVTRYATKYRSGWKSSNTSATTPTVSPMALIPLKDQNRQQRPLHESQTCRELLHRCYDQICDKVLAQWNSRNPYIQQAYCTILPRVVAFDKAKFTQCHANVTLERLLQTLRREKDRSQYFVTTGLFALAVEGENVPVAEIFDIIQENITAATAKKEKRRTASVAGFGPSIDWAGFTCLTLLARAKGDKIASEVDSLLGYLWTLPITPHLTWTMGEFCQQFPSLKKSIQEGLLDMLSRVLMQRPLRHPGMPLPPTGRSAGSSLAVSASFVAGTSSSANVSTGRATPAVDGIDLSQSQDPVVLTIALRTLGTFDFQCVSLMQFVRHISDHYLQSDHRDVRLEVVRTCCILLSTPLAKMKQTKQYSATLSELVQNVLSKLLLTAVTDVDPDVRYCVLAWLDDKFDDYLAQAQSLGALSLMLKDEIFEIRELALCVFGRLCNLNPAYVMPPLRKYLIEILTDLEYSGMVRNEEQAAKMLRHLLSNAPRLVKPYMEPILSTLVPKLQADGTNPSVVVCCLAAIGEQAQVSGPDMQKWMDKFLPIVIEMLQDSSSTPKRETALWTLGQVVESTGYVVEPYNKYPNLLDVLLNFLKNEPSPGIRREALRVLGLLGALDPFRHKQNMGEIDTFNECAGGVVSVSNDALEMQTNACELLVNMTGNLEDFYPAVTIVVLMRIMRDPALAQYHTTVVSAVVVIFKALGMRSVPYIPQVLPSFLKVIESAESSFREFLFQQLGILVSIVQKHIRSYLDDIFVLVKKFWTDNNSMQVTIINLVEQIVRALGSEFKLYLPRLVPHALRVLSRDTSEQRSVTERMLKALQVFGATLDEYMSLIFPQIVRLFDAEHVPLQVRSTALTTVHHLSQCLDLTEYASMVIHALVRTIDKTPPLRPACMTVLCAMVYQLKRGYKVFIPMVTKVLQQHGINNDQYTQLKDRIMQGNSRIDNEHDGLLYKKHNVVPSSINARQEAEETTPFKKCSFMPQDLDVCAASNRIFKDDWLEWLRQLSQILLKNSPSPAIRSCISLSSTYSQLPRDLFNAAFLSCWVDFGDVQRSQLIETFKQVLSTQDIPEVTQTILNLAEFMEHYDRGALPLKAALLGEKAMRCRAYAKALHYTEEQFYHQKSTEVLEALISINNKLQQPEAAKGVVVYAKKSSEAELKVKESWYEKLHDWDNALRAYQRAPDQSNPELILGQMRCLEVLGEWDQLYALASQEWIRQRNDSTRTDMARMASAACWGLGQWQEMEKYANLIPKDTMDHAFHQAVLAIHMNKFTKAHQYIDAARDLIDADVTAMASESYSRAYGAMVHVQMISELEEVIQYKLVPERMEDIKRKWWLRLQGCQRIVEDWQKILQVHSLVVPPKEDLGPWLKYASVCRRKDRLMQSKRILDNLLIDTNFNDFLKMINMGPPCAIPEQLLIRNNPKVIFAAIKQVWAAHPDSQRAAFAFLHRIAHSDGKSAPLFMVPSDDTQKLLAKCNLKLGQWMESLDGITELSLPLIIRYYHTATDHDNEWYKAWHAWAYMNYEAVLFYSKSLERNDSGDQGTSKFAGDERSLTEHHIEEYCIPALRGFLRSISLSHGNSLQDTLRLLTLWFDYGNCPEVYQCLSEGLKTVPVETWLQVVPQLIARIDTQHKRVQKLIIQQLTNIGKHHPQALIYPLTVASKSTITSRNEAASQVLESMREHSSTLVNQALLVSEELIRVAILWHEMWHEGLEEASRLYFGERNIPGMLATLEPLHAMMQRGPHTLKETAFQQAYGTDLLQAQEYCRKYQQSKNNKDLTHAWDLYYHVFRRISKQLPQLTSLELLYVSPKLLQCRDLELAIPGSYNPGQPIVRIERVESSLQVITSKQRPRKLTMRGSDGRDYTFLLKGHEDLRQDERVMQLFGLVNSLLCNDAETSKRNLTIQRYSVIPLSTNSGLIGWVPHCDTLHTLIRDFRDKKKTPLNFEHRIMLRFAHDYDHLPLMNKVEVFEHALETTNGDDLAQLLWLKSPSSEVWFERRTNYTRSLAVMSMVGYVLGLGDRHPSNLMLDRLSGKILHIDFGDCFEVAMTREKFPERIPFRLTRMLIKAMEVTGIEGTYRITCEKVMRVLRRHKDSLMAVLEAFVYDPLLNWRLIEGHATAKLKRSKSQSGGCQPGAGNGGGIQDAGDVLDSQDLAKSEAARYAVSVQQAGTLNAKAVTIIKRVREKLTGRDFPTNETLEVPQQVELLIRQATSNENLCQCYIGWCPFW